MNVDHMNDCRLSAINDLLKTRGPTMREESELFVSEAMQKKVDDGDAIELSDDELRMVMAYRTFLNGNPSKSVFKWRVEFDNEKLFVPAETTSLLVDPRVEV